jgi:hypothetical protein
MSEIQVQSGPDKEKLASLGVYSWPTWGCEVSEFPWSYDDEETCYFLEGEVEVTPEGGEPVRMGAGDLVTFPRGMRCTWKVSKPVKKHYTFA